MDFRAANIQPINVSSGLFIEEIAILKLYDSEWDLVIQADLSYFAKETDNLKDIVHSIFELKAYLDEIKPNEINESNEILHEFSKMLSEIENYNHHWISYEHKNTNFSRQKRSIHDDGITMQLLFGTLGIKDAIIYENQFDNLEKRGATTKIISEKQTTLLHTLIDQYSNVSAVLSEQQDNINLTVLDIKNKINKLQQNVFGKEWRYTKIEQLLHEYRILIDYVILLFQQFYKSQQLFVKSLTVTEVIGGSSPFLIPPKVMMTQLLKIQKIAQKNHLDLPFEVQKENLAKFYQLATIYSRIHNGKLFIKYSLPLTNTQQFLLHKMTSFPYLLNNNIYSFIIPRNEYIAIDNNSNKFFITPTNEDIQSCFRISQDTLLCKHTFPIFNKDTNKNCEMNILLHNVDTSLCNIRMINSTSDLWIKLEKANTYIYNLPTKKHLKLVCPNMRSENVDLKDAGIITIKEGCSINYEELRITGYQNMQSNNFITIIPFVKFHVDLVDELNKIMNNTEIKIEIPRIEQSNIVNTGEIKKLFDMSYNLDELHALETSLKEKISPKVMKDDLNIYSIWLIIFLVIIVILIVMYLFKKCY